MSIRVCIAVVPHALGSSVCGSMDVLGMANLLAARELFDVRLRTPASGPLHTSFGLRIEVKRGLPRAQQHLVVVPGFGVLGRAAGARSLREGVLAQVLDGLDGQARFFAWLRRQAAGGAIVGASCVGTFALAEAGLLAGKPATTSWWIADAFRARYPDVRLEPSHLLANAGAVVTAGAAMAHLDLALHFVERFGDARLARSVAQALLLDPGRRSQAAYAIPEHTRSQDEVVRRAVDILEAELASPPSMAELAGRTGVTQRTLHRRFRALMGCTPIEYRTRLRLDRARRLLEEASHSVDEVARAVGYADVSAFYRAFTGAMNMAPRDYQRRFAVAPRRRLSD